MIFTNNSSKRNRRSYSRTDYTWKTCSLLSIKRESYSSNCWADVSSGDCHIFYRAFNTWYELYLSSTDAYMAAVFHLRIFWDEVCSVFNYRKMDCNKTTTWLRWGSTKAFCLDVMICDGNDDVFLCWVFGSYWDSTFCDVFSLSCTDVAWIKLWNLCWM